MGVETGVNQEAGATPEKRAAMRCCSRELLVVFWCLSLVAAFFVLRAALFVSYGTKAGVSVAEAAKVFVFGLHRDVFVAVLGALPLLAWYVVVPARWFGRRWHRFLFTFALFVFWTGLVFLLAAEFFFFDEFRSRFNTVAVDYLLYPHEVFVNIWDSYPVAKVVLACSALGFGWIALARWLFPGLWEAPVSRRRSALWLGLAVLIVAALWPTVSSKGVRASRERLLNEIANNGWISFVSAALTRHLDYAAFYRTIPREEAYQRVRRMLSAPGVEFVGPADSLRRRVKGDPNRPKLNVVILMEESLGSEFWGVLGREGETCTPEMDRLAIEEGLLFTNIFASGNRTIRGFEGVLSSFPPLPGDSIVARDMSDNVETIARVLKRDGYRTLFVYGGRGFFDRMRAYAVENGYDRFIEQKDFRNPTFATMWGVCDEDILARANVEFTELARTGQPFLGTVLTVSNHKPYTYPKGRIPEDPEARQRLHAVKYSDYALGEFFRAAKKSPYWTNTVFVVVADHGARVYGSQSIPIRSYAIPLLIAGPAVVKAPMRIGHLGCSLDVAPTVLGLIGRPYETLFFGRDLLNSPPEEGRVLLHHNRDIGMFAKDRLVVLGLRKTVEFYAGDPLKGEIRPLEKPGQLELELERDTTAVFQVADELYVQKRFRLDP
ncbi:MAG TPA: LTA synthase family protein [Verrucomicrobiota bacterium]|nr:LTA synthase family protein [Verrucomicrobiota bacterium]